MPLVTAGDYIYMAYRICGHLLPGYEAKPELISDALTQWQMMFDAYNLRRTMNFTQPDYVFPITAPGHGVTGNGQTFGGSGYQIGPTSEDFVCPRPIDIIHCNYYLTQYTPQSPVRTHMTKIDLQRFFQIAVAVIPPIDIATVWAYDAQDPNGVIWLWPPVIGNALEVFTWGELTPPTSADDPFSCPPGYSDLIIKQLAVRLWPLCTRDIMPSRRSYQAVRGEAANAKSEVQRANRRIPRIANDFSGAHRQSGGVSDWALLYTGVSA